MPTSEAKLLLEALEMSLNIQCRLDIVPICSCGAAGKDGFPDLEYTIGGEKYFIPRDSYIMEYRGTCYLKIMHHPTLEFYLMGLTFFQNYYTVFDQESKKLGFAQSIYADPRLKELTKSA